MTEIFSPSKMLCMSNITTGEALSRLESSLNATNVLSEEYKRHILAWTYKAVEVAHATGKSEGIIRTKEATDKVLAEVAASLDSWQGESHRPSDSHLRQYAITLREAMNDDGDSSG